MSEKMTLSLIHIFLAKVGGLDIAGMAGVFMGGAVYRIPVVIDGFISCVAALVAQRISPLTKDYMIASHVSREPAAAMIQMCIRDRYYTVRFLRI